MDLSTPTTSAPADMQIALYEAQPDDPRSQLERIERAADGDLHARLELMRTDDVEAALSKASRPDHPEDRILAYLQNPGEGKTQADALKDVLDSFADKTEEIAILSAFVWQYARTHQLWTTHRNPLMRTELAFINNLEQNSLVQINIVTGTSAYAKKSRCLRLIEDRWGVDWFDRLPKAVQPPVDRPIQLSGRMLTLITAYSKSNIGLDRAIEAWNRSVRSRTDVRLRRQKRSRLPFSEHIVAADLEELINSDQREEDYGRRVVESHLPGLKEDNLRLQSLHPALPPVAPTSKPKRKRKESASSRAKRVKKSPAVADEAVEGDDEGEVDAESSDEPSASQASNSVRECGSLWLAAVVSKMITDLEEWKETKRCCDRCKQEVDEIQARIRGLRNPVIRLKEITEHPFDGLTASSLPTRGISHEKQPRKPRRTITVQDSSDVP